MSEKIKMGIAVGLSLPDPPPDSKYPIQDLSVDLVPEIITNKKNIDGTDHFLVKWKDVEQLSYVTESVANEKFSNLVYEFHRRHIKWAEIL
ncbi:unnamed protein product [Macrosiphum euphorbiae]|uniref:Chromo domain-containing protein n=1 Tax=Macrosiphum euphorbiae TaxID=13131 RepID=A0AAV0XSP1_9HEMI|nr:unnamed protein product [Macrosiphum euphorbiae]